MTPFVRRFLKRVQNTVATHALWGPKESFVVAVSGGPDSLCLLDVLFLLSQKYAFTLHIAHVNYRLRGQDSERDEALVRERAGHYHLPLSVLYPKKTSAANLEEKLRDIRYRFFENIRQEKNATLITVAHHEDDQAETFLLRLLRASGMRGLSAMHPKNNSVVRPLIEMSRADILKYLKERSLTYRTDRSNTDPKFLRNRVRNELLPLLEKEYQPRIKKILAATARTLAHDYTLIEGLTISLEKKLTHNLQTFSCRALLEAPPALQRHFLKSFFQPHFTKHAPPKSLIDECLKIVKSTKNKHQLLTSGSLKIERKGDTVRLLKF